MNKHGNETHSHDHTHENNGGHDHSATSQSSQRPIPDGQARFHVGGMDCASCASKIDTAVRRIPGVEDVSVSVTSGTMTVKHAFADLKAIEKQVSGLGYSVAPIIPTAKRSPLLIQDRKTMLAIPTDRRQRTLSWRVFTVMIIGQAKGRGGVAARGA